MAGRIRSIKPEWNESQTLGSCSDAARVLSVSLILLADDHGRGRAHPGYLAGQAWCYSGADAAKAEAALAELEAAGYVEIYEVDGSLYFQLPGWLLHQRVDKPGKEKVPPPVPGKFRETPGKVREGLGKIPLGTEGNRREQKGREREREGESEGKGLKPSPSAREMSAPRCSLGVSGTAPTGEPEAPKTRKAPEAPPEAQRLADRLRELLVAEKGTHALADDSTWSRKRVSWSREMAALLRLGREAERGNELLAWVFGDQGGTEFRFRVDSPKALREKWDRIETAMSRKPTARHSGYFQVTGEEKYAGGEVEI